MMRTEKRHNKSELGVKRVEHLHPHCSSVAKVQARQAGLGMIVAFAAIHSSAHKHCLATWRHTVAGIQDQAPGDDHLAVVRTALEAPRCNSS